MPEGRIKLLLLSQLLLLKTVPVEWICLLLLIPNDCRNYLPDWPVDSCIIYYTHIIITEEEGTPLFPLLLCTPNGCMPANTWLSSPPQPGPLLQFRLEE